MPQIIVLSGPATDGLEGTVMHRERVSVTDFESHHFAIQLVERLGWAVGDAHLAESRPQSESDSTAASLNGRAVDHRWTTPP